MSQPSRRVTPARAAPATDALAAEVLVGLHEQPKRLPSKYLYDARGSAFFDAICEQPEYYLTRTETAILARHAGAIARCIGEDALLVELGSGTSTKTRLLLDRLTRLAAYVPVDISGSHLSAAARSIAASYPHLEVLPVHSDFTHDFTLPHTRRTPARVVVFFPGSTIGNFDAPAAVALLQLMRRIAGARGGMVVGFDLVKDVAVLERAYDDAAGVTAAFNLNVLRRLNRELAANFDLDGFRHEAVWVPAHSRIEMHLVSRRAQSAAVAGQTIAFEAGERLVTEHCHKYTPDGFAVLAGSAGWIVRERWTDDERRFSVCYLEGSALPGR